MSPDEQQAQYLSDVANVFAQVLIASSNLSWTKWRGITSQFTGVTDTNAPGLLTLAQEVVKYAYNNTNLNG